MPDEWSDFRNGGTAVAETDPWSKFRSPKGQPDSWSEFRNPPTEEIKDAPTIGHEILSGNYSNAVGLIRDKLESLAAPAQPSSALRKPFTEPGSILGTNERLPYHPDDTPMMAQSKAIINWGNNLMAGLTGPEMVSAAPLAYLPGTGWIFSADIASHLPERGRQLKEAHKTPPGSPQRIEAYLGTASDLLQIIGGSKAHELQPRGGKGADTIRGQTEATGGAQTVEQGAQGGVRVRDAAQDRVEAQAPAEPVGVTETLAELKRRNVVTPGEVIKAEEPVSEPNTLLQAMKDDTVIANGLEGLGIIDLGEPLKGQVGHLHEIAWGPDGAKFGLGLKRGIGPRIAAHEVLHAIWRKNPDLQEFFEQRFANLANKGRGGRGKLSPSLAREEAFADFLDHVLFGGEEAWAGFDDMPTGKREELRKFAEAVADRHPIIRRLQDFHENGLPVKGGELNVDAKLQQEDTARAPSPESGQEKRVEPAESPQGSPPSEGGVLAPKVLGFGPGAAAAGEQLRPDTPTAKQLAELVAGVNTGKPDAFARTVGKLTEQAKSTKSTIEHAAAGIKNLAAGFKRLVWDAPTRTNFDRWVGDWDSTLQYNDFWIKKLWHELERAVPDVKRQEAIYNWAAADGDEALLKEWADRAPKDVKQGYLDALTLTEEEQRLANLQRGAYDEWLQRAVENGMLHEGVDNYLKRIVVKRPGVEDALRAKFAASKFSTNFAESKRRFWDNMIDAERQGIRYDKGIRGQSLYAQSFEHAAINRVKVRQFFDSDTETGRPFSIVEGTGIPIEPAEGSPALLVSPYGARNVRGVIDLSQQLRAQHPEWSEAKSLAIAKEQILAEYEPLDHPAFKNWQWVHSFEDGKQVFVRGDALVHKSVAKQLKNAFVKERIEWLEPVLKVQSFVKGSKLSLSLFHNVHEAVNAVGHLTNPANLKPLMDYLEMPEIRTAMRSGLKLVGSAHEQAYFAEGAGSHGWPELVPVLGEYVKAFKDASFEDWIPRLKAEAYLRAYERNVSGGASGLRPSRKLTAEQNAVLTARQVNATFGEQNYRQMMRDPRLQQALQGFFLAPDFGEAKIRHIAQAFTRYGSEQRMAIGLVAAGLYVGSRLLNKATSDDYHWEKPFSVIVGDREYTLRSLPGDLKHLVTDPRSYIYHRLSPGVSNAIESLTKKDYRGNAIDWSDYVKDTLLAPVPIPLTHREGLSWKDQLASAMGVTPMTYRYETELRKVITEFKRNSGDPKMIHQLERSQKETFLPSDYKGLRDSLRDGNLERAKDEYLKLIPIKGGGSKGIEAIAKAMEQWQKAPLTGSSAVEQKFKRSLTPEQRALYDKAKAERHLIYKQFREMRRANPITKQVELSQMSIDEGLQAWQDSTPDEREQMKPLLLDKLLKTRMASEDKTRIYRMIAGVPTAETPNGKFSILA